jgi:hypothetical protein
MENFLDTLFPFLVITVVLVSRVALALRRRNRNRQKTPAAPPKPARGFVPWEDEFREKAPAEDAPVQTGAADEDDDEDEAFSAWNLSVDDPPASPPVSPEAPPPAPLTAVRLAPERLATVPDQATAVLDRGAAVLDHVLDRGAAVPERPATDPARPLKPASKAPEQRFRGLSPLQQAVVWTEILGAPRGF